jgi:glutaredoxin 3
MGASSKFLSTTTTSLNASPSDFVTKEIDSHKVVIFSKTYCPYCSAAKDLLLNQVKAEGAQVYELDTMDNGADIQAALLELTGQRTVPNIFINQQHIGGNDSVQSAYRSGKLQELLNQPSKL